jgi:hypothetical protein
LGRKPIPEGRLEKLFCDRFNSSREDKPLKSTQLVARSDKPPLESLRRFTDLHSKDVGSKRFQFKTVLAVIEDETGRGQEVDDGESHDEIWETQDVGDGESRQKLYPRNDNFLTYFKCTNEGRSSFLIPSASSSVKDSISPMRSGNFSSCEHPEIFKRLRDFTSPMLSGRIFMLRHLFRFKKMRLFKFPTD